MSQATVYVYGANQANPPAQALPALRQGRYFNERLAYAVGTGGAYEDDLQIVAHVPNPSGDDYVSVEQRTAEVRATSPTVTYDADGNITSDGRWIYTWDALNRLVAMESPLNATNADKPDLRLEFAYDDHNRRIEKVVYLDDVLQTHHRYVYNGMDMIAEVNMYGGATVTGQYHWRPTGLGQAGRLLLASVDGEAVLAGHDGRGNITSYSDAFTGDLRVGREYTPFGETIRNSVEDGGDHVDIPFGFKGEYLDKETGLVYHGHRYYDPHWGRFISRDPIGEAGGANLYAYAGNDPVNKSDLWGLSVMDDDGFWRLDEFPVEVDDTRDKFPYWGGAVEIRLGYFPESWNLDPSFREFLENNPYIYNTESYFQDYMDYLNSTDYAGRKKPKKGKEDRKPVRNEKAQGEQGGGSSRSGLGNALRSVPILGGILGGVGDTLSGVGNIAVGNFGTGFSQIGGGLGRTIGNVWALPNTAVGLAYGGVGMVFGARPVWDSHDAILRFTNMPGWLMPSAMSLGHVQVYGPRGVMQPNRFGTPAIVEENLHTRQAEILGPLYLPLHGLTMGGSILTGGGTHRNNLLEMAPERGVGLWPWNINE